MARFVIYVMVMLGAVGVAAFGYYFCYRYPFWALHAFVVPSASMCPTICEHERIIGQIYPDIPYVPERGEVILTDSQSETKFIKRVGGMPGDIIAPGPKNEVLINGKAFQPPPTCGNPKFAPEKVPDFGSDIPFSEIQVAPGSYFVVGDNLSNSFDSRTKEFGVVRYNRIPGKALMIYFSPSASRLGCEIQ